MPISADWDNSEKTILRLTLVGDWTWDELHVTNPVITSLMRSVDHTVHMLVDYTQTRRMPGGGPTRILELVNTYPENFGILVIVTSNVGVRRALNAFNAISPLKRGKKLHGAATFEEAYRKFTEYQAPD